MSNFQIPEKVERTLYVMLGVGKNNRGDIHVYDFDFSSAAQSSGFEQIALCKKEITIDIPQGTDILRQQIQILEARRAVLHEKFKQELDSIDRSISELLALPAPDFDDSLPYTSDEMGDPDYCTRCSREFSFAELESTGGFCHFCISDADA